MPKARLHFDGDNTGIEKEARVYSLTQDVETKINSISTIETTLQGEIDDLQNQINQVASRGRYLSTWDCTTGLPDTNPTTDPYAYRAGDYYIVGTVGGTNYRPNGSEYHAGVQSQVIESQTVSVNDLYIYDGTRWTLQRTGASVFAVRGSITGNLQAQTDLQTALDAKANKTDVLEKTNTTSYTPTGDYHPATKKYVDDNDTFIGATAPTDNVVEGRLWYDTTADVLKVYNGSQWVPTGKTYTAGDHINITSADVISTWGLQEELVAGDNITFSQKCHSDMQGPAPDGFHVPLTTEWQTLINVYSALGTSSSFSADLKIPEHASFITTNGTRGASGTSDYHCSNKTDTLRCLGGGAWIGTNNYTANGLPIRVFKDVPVSPDSSWSTIYDGTSIASGAGVFWNEDEGLISVSSDGTTWYTIADKNLGAANVGDVGYYYQWGNNNGFVIDGITDISPTQVNASSYGPGNYYSSSTWVSTNPRDSSDNRNIWGGQTNLTRCEPVISATDTTYQASDFDIKDLTDSTGLRTKWDNKQDKVSAGRNINISGTTINARDTEYEAGNNVTITCPTESDMKGPCPSGFHVPTKDEIDSLVGAMITTLGLPANLSTAKTYLKMPSAGTRGFDSGNTQSQGYSGKYLTCSPLGGWAYILNLESNKFRTGNTYYSMGSSLRPFKNTPVVPDNTWTTLYDGSSVATDAGIFHNATEGLISISGDGTTWITMADKNVGATVLYNDGDPLSQSNCGGYFQWGNNYMFPFSGNVTTSSVFVDTTGYGPGNYYYSNVFIFGTHEHPGWSSSADNNLRGGQTQGTWQDCEHPIISAEGAKMVVLEYGTSTWQDFMDAYNKNAIVYCKVPSGSSGYRMAFMAYTAGQPTPTEVEFQYYRSRSSHGQESTQLDEVYVYKLTNAGTWTTTTRDTGARITNGTGISISSATSSGVTTRTISADTTVLATQTDLSSKADTTDVNTKTFYLADNQDTTTAQAALNRVLAGKNAILVFNKRTYLLYKHYSGQNCIFITCPTINDTPARWGGGYSATNTETLWLNYSGTTITSISNPSSNFGPKVLETDYNYGNPYTPLYDGSPATKKYVDDIASAKQNNMSAGEGIEIKNGDYSDMQGPCSAGYHVPLNSEWTALLGILYTTFGLSRGVELIGTYLKIPAAGLRDCVTSYAVGTAYAQYWSSSSSDSEKSYALIGIDTVASMAPESSANGYSIRPFKNVPVVPDGSNDWTTLYDGSSIATDAGIFYNATEGIISISGDGTTWITMADKNLGATTVYNRGDTKDNANCGGFFQWGNNYMFPGAYSSDSMTTDNIPVDTTGYGPENYYSDNAFIISSSQSIGWLSVDNPNLRGGVSQRSAVYNNAITVSEQYVNEHGAVVPVYYYLGDFNNDITFNIIEAGVYRLYVRAYHETTVDKTLTLTVDGVAVGALTSNLIEHLNASINFTASAGSTAVLSVSSKTNFTIQEVYIEKVNVQSGYLTATVN